MSLCLYGACSRSGEWQERENRVLYVDTTREDGVAAPVKQFADANFYRREAGSTGSVHCEIRTSQIEAAGDAPCHDIGKVARKSALLPFSPKGAQFADNRLHSFFRKAELPQHSRPIRNRRSGRNLHSGVPHSAHSKDHADARTLFRRRLFDGKTSVSKRPLRHIKRIELSGTQCFEAFGRNAEPSCIKLYLRHKTRLSGIGFVILERLWI